MRSRPFLVLAALAVALGCAQRQLAPEVPDDWLRVEDGLHRYGWDPQWGSLPAGMELGNTHGGMAVDAAGRIYASTDSVPSVLVFTADGALAGSWGEDLAGGLHALCLAEEDDREVLYLAHTARHEVRKTTLDGEVLMTVGWPEESGVYEDAGQYRPTGVAVAPDGRFWVADGYGRGWVHAYSAAGEWQACFGGPGEAPGQFRTPHGIAWDGRGKEPRLIVADRENGRLQVFTERGDLVKVIEGFRRPCGVAVGPELLAVPDLAGRVSLVSRDDVVVAHLGDQPDPAKRAKNGVPREEWAVGQFLAPHGAAWDAQGSLYVQDWNRHGRLTRLVPAAE